MDVWLTDTVSAHVTETQLEYVPRYSVSGLFVTLGDYRDAREKETLARETFGSADWLWSGNDELRFSRINGALASTHFAVPESLPAESAPYESWIRVPCSSGGLLIAQPQDFDLGSARVRWISPSGAHLVCLYQERAATEARSLRLRVAEGLDLLFSDRRLVGWLLESPERFITENWSWPSDTSRDEESTRLLVDYLALVSVFNVEKMQDGDETMRQELLRLEQRIMRSSARCEKKDVLLHAVRELVEQWYDE